MGYDLGLVIEKPLTEEELEQIKSFTPNEELKRLKWHKNLFRGSLFRLSDYFTVKIADADDVVIDMENQVYYPTGDTCPTYMDFNRDDVVAVIDSSGGESPIWIRH